MNPADELPEEEPAEEDLAEQFRRLWARRCGRSGGWRFNREEIYAERVHPTG